MRDRPKFLRESVATRSVLVTGGAGFIGSHLVDGLLDAGASKVVVIDNMFLGRQANLTEAIDRGAVLYRDDAERRSILEYLIEKHEVDVVFNCATKPLNYSFVDPGHCFTCNVNIAEALLELLRAGKYATLCHFSTSEVYGTAVYEPMDEEHPFHPHTPYAAGKAAADHMVQSYVKSFGVDAFIVRPFNNYGPRQNARPPLAAVIPLTIGRILADDPPELWGDGTQSRDFIYVTDTTAAILQLFRVLPAGESVNLSTDNQVQIGDLIQRVAALMQYDGPITRKEARAGDVQCHNASNAKARGLVDLAFTPFDQGLAQTVAWYCERANLIWPELTGGAAQ